MDNNYLNNLIYSNNNSILYNIVNQLENITCELNNNKNIKNIINQ